MEQTNRIKIAKRKLEALFNDALKSAHAVNLVHVSDTQPGILRIREAGGFAYLHNGKRVKNKGILDRIRNLVLPPAWEDVWICPEENGHLQAVGYDTKNRKQYKYHPLWSILRNESKFHHLYQFGKALPDIRQQLEKDLNRRTLGLEKMLAVLVSVMQHTCIRVGNNFYEKLYGSYGLTTLKHEHVTVKGETVRLQFKGKKGVMQDVTLRNRRLANIIKQCYEQPGNTLFRYYDDNGKLRAIDSAAVNKYLQRISGGNFTAKDFRTWLGTLHAIETLKQLPPAETHGRKRKNILAALDAVALRLGNTRTVCKKYYVHPAVLDHYTNDTLQKYLDTPHTEKYPTLSPEEHVLMEILEKG